MARSDRTTATPARARKRRGTVRGEARGRAKKVSITVDETVLALTKREARRSGRTLSATMEWPHRQAQRSPVRQVRARAAL
jgi:hypothetical protein